MRLSTISDWVFKVSNSFKVEFIIVFDLNCCINWSRAQWKQSEQFYFVKNICILNKRWLMVTVICIFNKELNVDVKIVIYKNIAIGLRVVLLPLTSLPPHHPRKGALADGLYLFYFSILQLKLLYKKFPPSPLCVLQWVTNSKYKSVVNCSKV